MGGVVGRGRRGWGGGGGVWGGDRARKEGLIMGIKNGGK